VSLSSVIALRAYSAVSGNWGDWGYVIVFKQRCEEREDLGIWETRVRIEVGRKV